MSTVVDQLIALYTAPNAQNNVSIAAAQKFQALLQQWGLGFNNLVAYASNSEGVNISVAQLLAYGVPATTPLNISDYNAVTNATYNTGEDLAIMAEDPSALNGYIKLYELRNPGSTLSTALAAAEQLPAVQAQVPAIFQAQFLAAGVSAS